MKKHFAQIAFVVIVSVTFGTSSAMAEETAPTETSGGFSIGSGSGGMMKP